MMLFRAPLSNCTQSAPSKETVRCPVATSLTVWAGVARIDIETAFENRQRTIACACCFRQESRAIFPAKGSST